MLFQPGKVVTTQGAMEIAEKGVDLFDYFNRHLNGDWGNMPEEDLLENDYSLTNNLRIFSSYATQFGVLWIITEADRSATTVLLPAEY